MTALPTFDAFFAELHGRPAFPWQRRLAADVLRDGWPDVLDLPTGVGKTSALDIALYCLAAAPTHMPRRIVLVVDRRIVVDQGAVHGRAIQRGMTDATDGPLAVVAERLRRLWDGPAGEPPFAIAVMRGGMPRDNDWARRPDQPLLGVSTVDQLGSRLLFRGYGVSGRSASVHAGLLGNDTLILLDEVHLATAFAETVDAVRRLSRRARTALPDRFQLTQMSATMRATDAARTFRLDDDDRRDPELARRLGASKRAVLRTIKLTGDDEPRKLALIAARAVQEAIELQAGGARVVAIVVNRVDTARLAAQLLRRHDTTDAVLVTGRMRPIERDHVVRTRLLPRAGATRDRAADARPLIVVATQCIEAGADLDFDALVTECASLDALRQRFGRVDRRGQLGTSTSVILGRSDRLASSDDDPVYGAALAATWQWLAEHAPGGEIDVDPAALPAAVDAAGRPRTDVLPPAVPAPVLLPAHLDAWAQTSQPPLADPEVAMWLHGRDRAGVDVQIVWRVHADPEAVDRDSLIDLLQACRPSALEAVTVPLHAARRWLGHQSGPVIADVEGVDPTPSGRDAASDRIAAVRWRGDDSEILRNPNELRPGDILVVDAGCGGIAAASFDPERSDPVLDLGDLAQLRGHAIATLRLDADALALWKLPAHMLAAIPAPLDDESPGETRARVTAWLTLWPEQVPPDFVGSDAEWHAVRAAWHPRRLRVTTVGPRFLVTAPGTVNADVDDAVTEDDDSSFRQREVTLAKHSTDVGDLAARYARSIDFDAHVVDDLALAARLHDVGKADPRFQRWLVGGSEVLPGELLAKSALPPGNAAQRRAARQRAGYPAGCRHELMSLAMVQHHEAVLRDAHDRDLVLHLIASHHGWCRPFPPPVSDPADLEVRMQHGGHELRATTRHELARLDSGVAARFWRLVEHYGWWGLAWLEAVMRLADHRASERETGGGR